jgi:hypothetical protein
VSPSAESAPPPQLAAMTNALEDELDQVLLGGFEEDGTGLRN